MKPLVHADCFSGIGGFSRAAEAVGWQTAFHCEINPWARQVLKYHYPNAELYEDITTTDFTIWRGRVDVFSGGFPCQPFSAAGNRKGTEDERHLWPSMLRAIREIRPRYVVGENVRGLINWDKGLVFEQVQADLEAAGYEVLPFLLPAAGVDAPHERYRIWFVAHCISHGSRPKHGFCTGRQVSENGADASGTASDTAGRGRGEDNRTGKPRQFNETSQNNYWQDFPTEPPICGPDDGLSFGLDDKAFSKWRNESIKAYGNAIVPQVAVQIFSAIQQMELLNT